MPDKKPATVDEYISGFSREVQDALQKIRTAVKQAAPEAEETISYDMPTFNLNGTYLIYFAGWKKHIALYPISRHISETLAAELSGYKGTKGSVHFPLTKPMPMELIGKIISLRIVENQLATR